MLELLPVQTSSLQFVTMNKLEKSIPRGLLLFTLYLVAPCIVHFLLEFEATLHNAMFVGRWSECICPWYFYRSVFLLMQHAIYESL